MILLLLFGFSGCGNEKEKKDIPFSYDSNSTEGNISFLFRENDLYKILTGGSSIVPLPSSFKGQETLILSSLESLNTLINWVDENNRTSIKGNFIPLTNTNFEYDSIVIVPFYDTGIVKTQTFVNIDSNDNATININSIIKQGEIYSPATMGFVDVFLVSKEIKTVNGYDNF